MTDVSTSSSAAVAPPVASTVPSANSSFSRPAPLQQQQQQRHHNPLKNVADQLQSLIDSFRQRAGLLGDGAASSSSSSSHSFEPAVRKLSDWTRELEETITRLSIQVSGSDSAELSVGFAELARQARRSVEVDVQRVVSRWVREFIGRHKASDPEKTFEVFRAVVEASPRETLTHGAPQLLDALLQWLLPRCARKCQRARGVLQRMQGTQRQLAEVATAAHGQLAKQRRAADDCDRIIAQCRVALSDFTSQSQQNLKEATSALQGGGGGGGDDEGQSSSSGNNSELAQQQIDRVAMSLARFSTALREHLSAVADKMNGALNSSESSSVPSAMLLEPSDKDLMSLLDESGSDADGGGGRAGGGYRPKRGAADPVVIEIQSTDDDKRRDMQERQLFADRSAISNNNNNTNNTRGGGGGGAGEYSSVNVATATSPLGSPISPAGGGNGRGSIHVQRLQMQLSEAQELLNNSERSQHDREAVIEQLQSNLTAMSAALERVAGERAGDVIAEQFGGTTRKGGFQSEVDMLRSQLAVSQERVVHLSSTVEERTLREQALQREVDTLRAGESVLKSELQYQQSALRASNDELVASQTALFETRELLGKCEKSRQDYVQAYNKLVAVCQADRHFAATLANQTKSMSAQLEQSVLLAQVEEMLGL